MRSVGLTGRLCPIEATFARMRRARMPQDARSRADLYPGIPQTGKARADRLDDQHRAFSPVSRVVDGGWRSYLRHPARRHKSSRTQAQVRTGVLHPLRIPVPPFAAGAIALDVRSARPRRPRQRQTRIRSEARRNGHRRSRQPFRIGIRCARVAGCTVWLQRQTCAFRAGVFCRTMRTYRALPLPIRPARFRPGGGSIQHPE